MLTKEISHGPQVPSPLFLDLVSYIVTDPQKNILGS